MLLVESNFCNAFFMYFLVEFVFFRGCWRWVATTVRQNTVPATIWIKKHPVSSRPCISSAALFTKLVTLHAFGKKTVMLWSRCATLPLGPSGVAQLGVSSVRLAEAHIALAGHRTGLRGWQEPVLFHQLQKRTVSPS